MSTNMSRWEPFRDIDTLMSRMTPALLSRWPFFATDLNSATQGDWSPSADISETEGEYLIRAALPAVAKDDIHVTVADGMVTIQGERKQEFKEKNERFHRVETFYGRFSRSFAVPKNANVEAIRCESKDGMLTVHVPKTAAPVQQERKVRVE